MPSEGLGCEVGFGVPGGDVGFDTSSEPGQCRRLESQISKSRIPWCLRLASGAQRGFVYDFLLCFPCSSSSAAGLTWVNSLGKRLYTNTELARPAAPPVPTPGALAACILQPPRILQLLVLSPGRIQEKPCPGLAFFSFSSPCCIPQLQRGGSPTSLQAPLLAQGGCHRRPHGVAERFVGPRHASTSS